MSADAFVPCSVCGKPTPTPRAAIRGNVMQITHPECRRPAPPPPPTVPMVRALTALANAGQPRDLHASTRRALLTRGLVREHETVLIITPAGREALATPLPDQPRFLSRGSRLPAELLRRRKKKSGKPPKPDPVGDHGYTTNPARAIDDLEAVDDKTLRRYADEARERDKARRGWLDQQLLDEKASLEESLVRAVKLARSRGVDVRSDVRVIRARIAAIEKKATRRERAA
jgi:hypothetical protein